jgi:CxxC motif-containing protein (DUF1111 family)
VNYSRSLWLITISFVVFSISTMAEEPVLEQFFELLGGETTSEIKGHDAIQVTAPNVRDPKLIEGQLAGFSVFHRTFRKSEGLGPAFINSSCRGCHVLNGKGPLKLRKENSRQKSTVVVRVSLGPNKIDAQRQVPRIGGQIKDSHTARRKRNQNNVSLRWEEALGRYPDGTSYTLRKPILGLPQRRARRQMNGSLRMSPMLFGMGLIEAIPEQAVLALSDPEDRDNDGISGKPNFVIDERTGLSALGRFGFKASQPTLEQQNASAALHDMGITSPLLSQEAKAEISAEELEELTLYLALAGVPKANNQSSPRVQFGYGLFRDVGCQSCHVPSFISEHPLAPLDGQLIHPFTDLLLHDMGPDLSDRVVEGEALGQEWRTTPLWGLGFAETVSQVKPVYLHDGRARTIEEAILWHGGEAENSRNAFKALNKAERDLLIAFLESL